MTKRVFVTVGTTSFDELIQAVTEDKFLKVCYVESSVHVCCVHNKHSGHSTVKVLWLGPYPVCSIKVGWDSGVFRSMGVSGRVSFTSCMCQLNWRIQ